MKKIIFVFLFIVPFCKAADYQKEAQDALQVGNWQDIYRLIDEKKIDVNNTKIKVDEKLTVRQEGKNKVSLIQVALLKNNLDAALELLKRGAKQDGLFWSILSDYIYGSKQDTRLIEELLKRGANPHTELTPYGTSIYDFFDKLHVEDIEIPRDLEATEERRRKLLKLFDEYSQPGLILKPVKRQWENK